MDRRRGKTYYMQLVERDHADRPIEAIMIEAYHEYGSERAAAEALGIKQQVFNNWKYRLGIDDAMRKAQSIVREADHDHIRT